MRILRHCLLIVAGLSLGGAGMEPIDVEIGSLGLDHSSSRCGAGWFVPSDAPTNLDEKLPIVAHRPPLKYPELAQGLSIEGEVSVRGIVGVDARFLKRTDPNCTCFAEAKPRERRAFWHPKLCIEADRASYPERRCDRQHALDPLQPGDEGRSADPLPHGAPLRLPPGVSLGTAAGARRPPSRPGPPAILRPAC